MNLGQQRTSQSNPRFALSSLLRSCFVVVLNSLENACATSQSGGESRRTRATQLKFAELSYAVIGCAMDVHKHLGPGLEERFYHAALCDALAAAGISHRYKPSGKLVHRGHVADAFEADIIVGGQIALELKALSGAFAPGHLTQIISYLKFWSLELGILLDFGKERLVQRRVPFTPPYDHNDKQLVIHGTHPSEVVPPLSERIFEAIYRIYRTYDLGYRDTMYKGLLYAELTEEGMSCRLTPNASILCSGGPLGEMELDCLVVGEELALKVVALYARLRPMDRAIL